LTNTGSIAYTFTNKVPSGQQEASCRRPTQKIQKNKTKVTTMKRLPQILLAISLIGLLPSISNAKKIKPSPDKKITVAPLQGENIQYIHAPFETGECDICHTGNNPKNPGPISGGAINEICFSCHDSVKESLTEGAYRYVHHAAVENCTSCHNPHNSPFRFFLNNEAPQLCTTCHTDIEKLMNSKVNHGALTRDRSCLNCHDPHTSNVQNLLLAQPFDLCINCHNSDFLEDENGKELTNFQELLTMNPRHHSPVEQKDCSACHQPHGSDNFRLLVEPYPAKFYSPFDPENYSLCFSCHDEEMVLEKRTTTATNFRDGDRNLHYLHVNKSRRGRTCRACHEVHASHQPYQIRDSVPYGSRGWMLKINYTEEENGGSCTKTCHSTKTYNTELKK